MICELGGTFHVSNFFLIVIESILLSSIAFSLPIISQSSLKYSLANISPSCRIALCRQTGSISITIHFLCCGKITFALSFKNVPAHGSDIRPPFGQDFSIMPIKRPFDFCSGRNISSCSGTVSIPNCGWAYLSDTD